MKMAGVPECELGVSAKGAVSMGTEGQLEGVTVTRIGSERMEQGERRREKRGKGFEERRETEGGLPSAEGDVHRTLRFDEWHRRRGKIHKSFQRFVITASLKRFHRARDSGSDPHGLTARKVEMRTPSSGFQA